MQGKYQCTGGCTRYRCQPRANQKDQHRRQCGERRRCPTSRFQHLVRRHIALCRVPRSIVVHVPVANIRQCLALQQEPDAHHVRAYRWLRPQPVAVIQRFAVGPCRFIPIVAKRIGEFPHIHRPMDPARLVPMELALFNRWQELPHRDDENEAGNRDGEQSFTHWHSWW